ncbi:hypothetical protein [Rhodohalobacter sp. SW132]|uniref:hypothetical protein n=1 Tax=Rhodohalobacter sp. SW132 TaxID=2293433 RepID=UPI0011C0726F|nr:hypothetical protein [Rhodohalobacter sp. SW132]
MNATIDDEFLTQSKVSSEEEKSLKNPFSQQIFFWQAISSLLYGRTLCPVSAENQTNSMSCGPGTEMNFYECYQQNPNIRIKPDFDSQPRDISIRKKEKFFLLLNNRATFLQAYNQIK